ncbi:MAG TPA: IPTL-CTERM sorting domain-containing protein [Thermoanaerobaculia bacterium]|nr:IPTL-CTERM sorting domain-containing protein [Thermoanaerobaculia bacterium]
MPPPPIPTLSEWGLLILSLLLGGIGFFFVRGAARS